MPKRNLVDPKGATKGKLCSFVTCGNCPPPQLERSQYDIFLPASLPSLPHPGVLQEAGLAKRPLAWREFWQGENSWSVTSNEQELLLEGVP